MHWLRIDRYYSSDDTFEGDLETKENIAGLGDSLTTFGKMEQAAENPQVTFSPLCVSIVTMHLVKRFVLLQLLTEDRGKTTWRITVGWNTLLRKQLPV